MLFSSTARAADDYVGGIPVRNYYGHPVPDMFEITGQGFEAAISDLGRGARNLAEDVYTGEKGKTIKIPWGFPKDFKILLRRINSFLTIYEVFNSIGHDSKQPSLEDIPIEVGGEDTPRGRGSIDDPGTWESDYTGDFPDGFGDDYSGTS